MKRSNLKLFSLLLLAIVLTVTFFNCKKTSFPADPNENAVVKRELVVSALDVFTKDSIGQFNVTVVTPTATSSQVTTGNTYKIKDPVAGTYRITITKTGYADPEVFTITVVVPTDPKASYSLPASVLLTKAAAPVTVTGATGAVIAVKTNSQDAGSVAVAAVAVAPGTVFTLADGSKPASVAISVSNVPLAVDLAPTANVNGVNTKVTDKPIEVINGQVASQKLDLQPSGLVLSQPMTIDMYIGNDYPPTMSVAEKTARQAGLTLNYVRKDGTVEVVTPDRFSADRNTVYYKITHFSQWGQTNKYISLVQQKALTQVQRQAVATACAQGLTTTLSLTYTYSSSNDAWALTGSTTPVTFASTYPVNIPASSGFYPQITVSFGSESFILTDSTPGFSRNFGVNIPTQGNTATITYNPCHQ